MQDSYTLDMLKIGMSGQLVRLELEPSAGQRLMEMGLTPGTRVGVVRMAPFGDPVELEVRGSRLSIRKSVARRIVVQPLPQAPEPGVARS
ncbi:MAG: FeoA family protein [Verrucomicrobiota bacterium]